MSNQELAFIAVGLLLIWLATKPMTWIIILFVSLIAIGISFIASIIHFQVLAALGLWVLAMIIVYLLRKAGEWSDRKEYGW